MGIFSSIFGGDAQKNSAKNQRRESRAALGDSLGYVEPFAKAGGLGLKAYLDGIGLGDSDAAIKRFEASPEYRLNFQNALDEGRKGVSAVAQGTGTYNSGRTLKALEDRATMTSRNFLSDYLKGIAGVAETGFDAAKTKGLIRTGGAQMINQGHQALADAKTAQYAGFDNLLSGALKFAGSF